MYVPFDCRLVVTVFAILSGWMTVSSESSTTPIIKLMRLSLGPPETQWRYKTDDSHAFDHWNSLTPDINFLGIAVYKK